jgi:hypothetical protein
MDERQKLNDDLKRYRTMRQLPTDEPAIGAIEIMIRETEDRLAEIESRPRQPS